jgi:hypothetical protein
VRAEGYMHVEAFYRFVEQIAHGTEYDPAGAKATQQREQTAAAKLIAKALPLLTPVTRLPDLIGSVDAARFALLALYRS